MSVSPNSASRPVPMASADLRVTALGLGTTALGGLYDPLEASVAEATMAEAVRQGVRFFDTAPQYGHGLAERRLGEGLQGLPRDSYVVATKVGRLLRAGAHLDKRYYFGTPEVNPVFDFSYDGVMRSVEESLERLGLDRVDILHVHDPDDHVEEALDGAVRALRQLRDEGSISAVGAGMNQSAVLTRFARTGDFDCFLLAGRYTLLEQGPLDDLLPEALDRSIDIFAGGVFNSGVLANPSPDAHYDYETVSADVLLRVRRLAEVCAAHDVPLKAAALQFPAAHPAITSVLVGARTPQEIAENCALAAHPVPVDLWAELRAEGLLRADAPTPR